MGGIFLVEWAAGWVRVTGTPVTREGSLALRPGILVPLVGYVFVGVATVVQGGAFALMHVTNPSASVVSTFNLFLIAFLLAPGFVLTGERPGAAAKAATTGTNRLLQGLARPSTWSPDQAHDYPTA